MGSALRFKHTQVPRQQGEQARFKVVQGPDYGAVYVLVGTRAIMGRGEDVDMIISDLKMSRRHAEIESGGTGWEVRDLGSANGILHNGKQVKSAFLKNGDTITLGETTLEFVVSNQATMMLVAPPRSMDQIKSEQAALEAQKKRVKGLGLFGALGSGSAGAAPQKKKLMIYGALALGAAFLLLGEDPKPQKKKTDKKSGETRNLASYLPDVDPAVAKPAEMFFRTGFREYREKNYLRAKQAFETVLQMAPGHPLATLYLENATKAIEDEVKFHLEHGKRGIASGKLKAARAHYEAVMRLLYRDQSSPAYTEAKDQLQVVTKKMNGEEG